MIDENKLIEDIAEYMRNVYGCDLEDVVGFQTDNENKSVYIVQGLYEAVSIIYEQPKNDWIPCKIELPKTNGVYQVKRVVYEGCFKNYIVTCAYFDGQNTWHNDNRVNHSRPYLKDVIAWKLLDEP